MISRKIYYLVKSFQTAGYSRQQLEAFQTRLLDEMIEHTYRYSPFYRRLWSENGFEPKNFEELEDLQEIPVAGMEAKREVNSDGIPVDKTKEYVSTGAAGDGRTVIKFEEQAADWTEAKTLRAELMKGYRPGRKILKQWGMPSTRTGRILRPETIVPGNASIDEQLELMQREDPDYLTYGAHVLLRMARRAEQQEIGMDIKGVFNNGELLTPSMRDTIEDVFSTTVHDFYETSEFGQLAWACPGGGYHLNEDLVYPEILDGDGERVEDGETGELVVSGLVNRATPLLRYRTGDLVVKGGPDCSCDTSFRKIEQIRGRKGNVLENRSGDRVYPRSVVEALSGFDEIEKFVLVEDSGSHVLRYVPKGSFDSSAEEEILGALSGLGLDADLEEVQDVKRKGRKAAPVRVRD